MPATDVAHLGDDMVREETAHVVLEDRKGYAIHCHERPHERDVFCPGLGPCEEINRCFCRINTQKDARDKIGTRVGIRKPGMQGDEGHIHANPQHDQD